MTDGRGARRRSRERRASGRRRRLRAAAAKLATTIASQITGAVIGVLVGLALAWAIGVLHGRERTAETKLEDVLSDAARSHLRPVFNREVDLKGTGMRARVLIFRASPDRDGLVSDSDRLLVYEVDDNRLTLALSVHPSFHRKRNLPYEFLRIRVGRFDDTTQQEVVFDMSPLYADTTVPHPVALLWDAGQRTYLIRALLTRPPRLPVPAPRSFARGLRDAYEPNGIPLDGGGTLENVGGAQEFAMARARLATAYVVRDRCNACRGATYTVRTYLLDFQRGNHVSSECRPGKRFRRATPEPKVYPVDRGPTMRVALRTALHDRTLVCP